jgi:hypothetical protein
MQWIFNIKLINNMLPFADILQQRFGQIFHNWSCPLCDIKEDSLFHLLTCQTLKDQWADIFANIITSVHKFINKHDLSFDSQSFIRTILPHSNDNLHFIQDNLNNWLKGFIDTSTISQVVQFTKSKPLATALILKIVVKLQTLFRSHI